jgi:hypothetical protein
LGGILPDCEDRTIFQTPEWLSFIAETQRAEPVLVAFKQGSRTVGYFSGLIVYKFGFKILGSPMRGWTTSYMGLNLSQGVSRCLAIEKLIQFAFDEWGCVHVELMDRHLNVEDAVRMGYEYQRFSGFEIDLMLSEDRLFADMTSACRRCVRKAVKERVLVEEAHDLEFADEYYAQLEDVFAKQSLVPTYGIERIRQLITHIHPTGHLLLLRARDPGGRCIATGIFPHMNGVMYFWGGASWRQFQFLRPNEPLHWYAMRYAKAQGLHTYDMGGGGKYKKKYGGREIQVPWVRVAKYPWISFARQVADRYHRIRQCSLGRLRRVVGYASRPADHIDSETVM